LTGFDYRRGEKVRNGIYIKVYKMSILDRVMVELAENGR